MSFTTASEILKQAALLDVPSIKLNWRGESHLNPYFFEITELAKELGFVDRISNSNFNFAISREDIFWAFSNQTTVKISFDSFYKDVFLAQRKGADVDRIMDNIDKFYHYPKRKNKIIIQMVRTEANKNENFEKYVNRLWPNAYLSVRDCVPNRVGGGDNHTVLDLSTLERRPCLQAFARLIFAHDGQATCCCPDIETRLLGPKHNIHTMSISEIWNSEAMKLIRRDLKSGRKFKMPVCQNCSSLESYEGYQPNWNS